MAKAKSVGIQCQGWRFILELHGSFSPEYGQVPSDHISFQYNNSEFDRLHTSIIYSGEIDSRLTAQLIQWAGSEHLGNWRNSADRVNGTEGIIWQPFLEQDEEIVAFISDTQRYKYCVHYSIVCVAEKGHPP